MLRYLLVLSLFMSFLYASELGISEKLGDSVSLDLKFINEKSEVVTLRELMDGKPTLLTLNYFKCSGICTPQLNDMADMLARLDLKENIDYRVLTVSFAETETGPLAAAKKRNLLASMTRAFDEDAWSFVIGKDGSSKVLADEVGFYFQKDVLSNGNVEYIHGAALIALSPEGKITRYLNGIDQLPFDVKMSVLEAADGKVGPTIAKTLLFCFAYDPKGKTYVFAWEKIAATVMLTIVLVFFIWLVKSGRREENHEKKGEDNE